MRVFSNYTCCALKKVILLSVNRISVIFMNQIADSNFYNASTIYQLPINDNMNIISQNLISICRNGRLSRCHVVIPVL